MLKGAARPVVDEGAETYVDEEDSDSPPIAETVRTHAVEPLHHDSPSAVAPEEAAAGVTAARPFTARIVKKLAPATRAEQPTEDVSEQSTAATQVAAVEKQ
ncbi:MAG: hypothetical protein WKF84_10590 [Pyrinomonadaceae bacterium]